jgi:hypothetical protein
VFIAFDVGADDACASIAGSDRSVVLPPVSCENQPENRVGSSVILLVEEGEPYMETLG